MELTGKHKLEGKGNGMVLKMKDSVNSKFEAVLAWKTSVDLDLHCMYQLADGRTVTAPIVNTSATPVTEELGLLGKIIAFFTGKKSQSNVAITKGSTNCRGEKGHLYFGRMGSKNSKPWIRLSGDEGIGDTVSASGYNEEVMEFSDIDKISSAIIVANIYGKNSSNFGKYNGFVSVKGGNHEITVPLDARETGAWCTVALITNNDGEAKITNINKTQSSKPALSDFI